MICEKFFLFISKSLLCQNEDIAGRSYFLIVLNLNWSLNLIAPLKFIQSSYGLMTFILLQFCFKFAEVLIGNKLFSDFLSKNF